MIAGLLALSVVLTGCSGGRSPVLAELRDVEARDVVVLIPGMTGTQLRERDGGRVLWGDTRSLLAPRDGGRTLALSVADLHGSAARLEPFAPIYRLSLLGFKREIYAPVQRLLESNGYRAGDLRQPGGADNFFFFDYDWRLGAVDAARSLTRSLEALRAERGTGKLRVALICQSSAALIARYAVKYGDVALEQAEAGARAPLEGVAVTKLIFVGASNGGALRVLRQMNEGRRYIRAIGRRVQPETLFTFPTLYEGLPVEPRRLFFDDQGRLLDVDLFDAAAWERYGWSIWGPQARKRLQRESWDGLLGDEVARMAHLRKMLERAQRLHALLQADPAGFDPPAYYSLQNDSTPTAERALLVRRKGRWETRYHDDRVVRRDPTLLALASAPGDGHATLDSQTRFSPAERSALAGPAFHTAGGHFEIILDAELQERILEYLLE